MEDWRTVNAARLLPPPLLHNSGLDSLHQRHCDPTIRLPLGKRKRRAGCIENWGVYWFCDAAATVSRAQDFVNLRQIVKRSRPKSSCPKCTLVASVHHGLLMWQADTTSEIIFVWQLAECSVIETVASLCYGPRISYYRSWKDPLIGVSVGCKSPCCPTIDLHAGILKCQPIITRQSSR